MVHAHGVALIPADSNYRDVRPMAMTLTKVDGQISATPWAIDYRSYQDPELNEP